MTRLPAIAAAVTLLLALTVGAARAQAARTITLAPGDTLTAGCATRLSGGLVDSQTAALNCALTAVP